MIRKRGIAGGVVFPNVHICIQSNVSIYTKICIERKKYRQKKKKKKKNRKNWRKRKEKKSYCLQYQDWFSSKIISSLRIMTVSVLLQLSGRIFPQVFTYKRR